MRPSLLHVWLFLVSVAPAQAEEPGLTLADGYALALKQSETIATRQELIKETEGQFVQALSTALPRASFALSEKRQDGSGGSAFTLKQVPERKFVFTQPLFSGFKEFAAIAGSRAKRRQREHEKVRAEHLLFMDVAEAFHLLVQQEGDRLALESIRTTLLERIKDLEDRVQLGRSRPSEVVSVEAQLRRIEAELEQVRSQGTTARQLLEFLTGRSPLGPIIDDHPDPLALPPETEWVAKASARPDVRAAEEAWSVTKKEVWVARAGFWPDVDLESNYYTQRVGIAQDVDWDALLTVDVPLFKGGETVGDVRTATSKARQAKLALEETTRKAVLDIRNAYATLQGSMARHIALLKALEAAEENYRLQVEDYKLNLVNNLDVLQALELLLDARRDVVEAQQTAKRDFWKLRVATGETL